MIITARRSTPHFLFDSLLTCAGWLLFFYLLYGATAGWWSAWGQDTVPGHAPPAMVPVAAWLHALGYPLGVLAILLLAGSWHVSRRQHEGDAGEQPPLPNPLNDELLAGHFFIERQALEQVHDSRHAVIHMSDDGTINRMELANALPAPDVPNHELHQGWSNSHRQYSVVHPSPDSIERPTENASTHPGRTAHALSELSA